MSRIKQFYSSPELNHFRAHFSRNYGLSDYYSKDEPSVFYGCYSEHDLNMIRSHRSLGVVVWGGSDIMNKVRLRRILEKKNLRYVARSDFIVEDLLNSGVGSTCFRKIPLISTNVGSFQPTIKKNKIYCYKTANYKVRQDAMYEEVKTKLRGRFKIIEKDPRTKINQSEMDKLLGECFIGLRLVSHDGLSNTVIELGLKGRKCLWNGGSPNSIPYKNADDVVNSIFDESRTIGTIDKPMSDSVAEFVETNQDWLELDFWNE